MSGQHSAETTLSRFRSWVSSSRDTAVLDAETTDMDGEIIELAIVTLRGEVLFNERMRPVYPVSPGALAVHGITDADLVDRPTIARFWPRIRRLISDRQILVYNREFDFRALCRSLDLGIQDWYKNPDPVTRNPQGGDPYSADYWVYTVASRRAQCVMEAYAPLAGYWNERHSSYSWARLGEACAQRGVDLSDLAAHSALGDAIATARLVQACAAADPAEFPWIGQEQVEASS